jgi:hypothetical protein
MIVIECLFQVLYYQMYNVPKIDEVRLVIKKTGVDIAVFTETWLKHVIPDSVVHIPGYNKFEKTELKEHMAEFVFTFKTKLRLKSCLI